MRTLKNFRLQEMPRRSILYATERDSLLTLLDTKYELIRHYSFNESDLALIRQRRGPANRLGFAVQLWKACRGRLMFIALHSTPSGDARIHWLADVASLIWLR